MHIKRDVVFAFLRQWVYIKLISLLPEFFLPTVDTLALSNDTAVCGSSSSFCFLESWISSVPPHQGKVASVSLEESSQVEVMIWDPLVSRYKENFITNCTLGRIACCGRDIIIWRMKLAVSQLNGIRELHQTLIFSFSVLSEIVFSLSAFFGYAIAFFRLVMWKTMI